MPTPLWIPRPYGRACRRAFDAPAGARAGLGYVVSATRRRGRRGASRRAGATSARARRRALEVRRVRFAARWGYGRERWRARWGYGRDASRRAGVACFVLQLLRAIGVNLDSLRARRCRDRADGDHSGAQTQ